MVSIPLSWTSQCPILLTSCQDVIILMFLIFWLKYVFIVLLRISFQMLLVFTLFICKYITFHNQARCSSYIWKVHTLPLTGESRPYVLVVDVFRVRTHYLAFRHHSEHSLPHRVAFEEQQLAWKQCHDLLTPMVRSFLKSSSCCFSLTLQFMNLDYFHEKSLLLSHNLT